MAKAMEYGKEDSVTLATTQTTITGVDNATELTVWESDTNLYVVTHAPSDGAALPSNGRFRIPTSALPITVSLSEYGPVALAGAATGTCRVTFHRV